MQMSPEFADGVDFGGFRDYSCVRFRAIPPKPEVARGQRDQKAAQEDAQAQEAKASAPRPPQTQALTVPLRFIL